MTDDTRMDSEFDALLRETQREIESMNTPSSMDAADYLASVPYAEEDAAHFAHDDEYLAQTQEETPPDEPEEEVTEAPRRKRPTFFQRRRERRRRKRKDSISLSIFGNVIYFVLVAAAAIMLAKFAWLCADDVLALTKQDKTAQVEIAEGDSLNKITQKLSDAGLINYPWLFKIYGKYSHVEDNVVPGVYELNTLFDYHALVNGMQGSYNRMTTTVTIIEGKTSMDIFRILEEAGVCSADALAETAASGSFDYDFLADTAENSPYRLDGYLFPDTYQFYLADEPENVINKFLSNFSNRMDETMMAKVAASGFTLREILSIASIIQEESADPAENKDISSVIHNRLASDSLRLLQMDSTVYYAAERMETEFDTTLDSPYNTYQYPGLPVGPIDNPGLDAITAALEPADTNFYFFAYGKDGLSHFYSDWDSFAAFLNSEDYIGAE